jgi:3-oxoacyl-[acyl-carrier protein] reductase/meso-butanediol dehydrogenase/(S,S)-butanediol dehydrogenase/diacetyl reductase
VSTLEGKTCVVTGGTRGIGLAIVEAFSGAGAAVVVGARNPAPRLDEIGATFIPTNVRVEREVRSLVDRTCELHGSVDIMINDAGISIWRALDDVDEGFFRELVDTNLGGTLWGCKAAAARMSAGASIVNVASLAGRRGSANNSVYCASKFGVVGLTQALAKELGPRGIRVNAVCPVYVRTDALLASLRGDHPDRPGDDPQAFLDRFAATGTALGRLPEASEVAKVCLFLASDAASAITGQSINVDCGALPQ